MTFNKAFFIAILLGLLTHSRGAGLPDSSSSYAETVKENLKKITDHLNEIRDLVYPEGPISTIGTTDSTSTSSVTTPTTPETTPATPVTTPETSTTTSVTTPETSTTTSVTTPVNSTTTSAETSPETSPTTSETTPETSPATEATTETEASTDITTETETFPSTTDATSKNYPAASPTLKQVLQALKKTADDVKKEIQDYTLIVKEINVNNITEKDVNKTAMVASGLSLLVETIKESPDILENLRNDPTFEDDLKEATSAANDVITEIEQSEGLSLGSPFLVTFITLMIAAVLLASAALIQILAIFRTSVVRPEITSPEPARPSSVETTFQHQSEAQPVGHYHLAASKRPHRMVTRQMSQTSSNYNIRNQRDRQNFARSEDSSNFRRNI